MPAPFPILIYRHKGNEIILSVLGENFKGAWRNDVNLDGSRVVSLVRIQDSSVPRGTTISSAVSVELTK